MDSEFELIYRTIFIGIGATLFMDLWALFQKVFFKIPSLNYCLVGRWIGHLSKGRISHNTITQSPPIIGEQILGWTAHYLIGIIFTWLFIVIMGISWTDSPTLLAAIIMGAISTVAPFFIMQPCFGFGFAASKTPKPHVARLRSLVAHVSFGIGLYLSALLLTI
ncbi:DUF2938 domain-containing protein [Photorhabdus temperata]|uniref:DUF2938 domain-containing protein n=2 Tax=Photorhabdus temperata TaxID=574560 RepID=A0A081RTW5_PHOTE|nr:DUF2938 domain-containing protein [Photorhabdus temperata]EQB98876.1 hypothetical protein B738_21705 [Photorhabdus temperata subsp. temperata M1021]ERT12424.1 hypothetical protein O185_14115 [Photorhabdus temperata J3]KER02118.1 Protein of unknown function (DUF2938) [Photorhabdus temperata subsp. temperata Meg1]MCT8346997.1 DUF2938 domain-containing protein [Photorhabdus temperata]